MTSTVAGIGTKSKDTPWCNSCLPRSHSQCLEVSVIETQYLESEINHSVKMEMNWQKNTTSCNIYLYRKHSKGWTGLTCFWVTCVCVCVLFKLITNVEFLTQGAIWQRTFIEIILTSIEPVKASFHSIQKQVWNVRRSVSNKCFEHNTNHATLTHTSVYIYLLCTMIAYT